MKKIIALIVLSSSMVAFGLDGYSQVRMEKIYDIYRTRFIDGRSAEDQTSRIQKIQKGLQLFQTNPNATE